MRFVVIAVPIAFGTGCMRPYVVNQADLVKARELVVNGGADPYIPAVALADNRETYLRVRKTLVPAAVILGFAAFGRGELDSLMAVTGGVLLVIGLSLNKHESDGPTDGFGMRVQGGF
jgi:hypothetical protein